MAILDEPINMLDPITVPARPTGVRWGLIAGVAGVILSALFTMTGLMKPGQNSWTAFLINIALWVAICYMAIKQHRDEELGGYISLGRCVALGLWIGLVAGVIGAVYILIYSNIINPNMMAESMDNMREGIIEKGQSEEAADRAVAFSRSFMNPNALAILSVVFSVIFYVIISLVEGLFMKKDPPFPA